MLLWFPGGSGELWRWLANILWLLYGCSTHKKNLLISHRPQQHFRKHKYRFCFDVYFCQRQEDLGSITPSIPLSPGFQVHDRRFLTNLRIPMPIIIRTMSLFKKRGWASCVAFNKLLERVLFTFEGILNLFVPAFRLIRKLYQKPASHGLCLESLTKLFEMASYCSDILNVYFAASVF